MSEKRPQCSCGHSYWSHHTGFYNAQGQRDGLYGPGTTLRCVCERTGCRCIEYTAAVRAAI